VRLLDVDDDEGGAVAVLLVEAFQIARLAAEGRSGVAPENQDHGRHPGKAGEVEPLAFRSIERDLRRGIADPEGVGLQVADFLQEGDGLNGNAGWEVRTESA
jgi:hypothetical protein